MQTINRTKEMKDKAKEILDKYNSHIIFYKAGEAVLDEESIIDLMLEFGRLVADEQKEECAMEARTMYRIRIAEMVVDTDSILNCKNVCDL